MKTCPKCNRAIPDNATWCQNCGNWLFKLPNNSTERQPLVSAARAREKSDTPIKNFHEMCVELDEEMFKFFMKELQDKKSTFRTQISKATSEEEIRDIIEKTITRLSGQPAVVTDAKTISAASKNTNEDEDEDEVPAAGVAYAQAKKQNESSLYAAKRKAEEVAKDAKAVKSVIVKLTASIKKAIKEGQFKVEVPLSFSELSNKTENYNSVKTYFINRGYCVTATLNNHGTTLSILVSWQLN